MRISAKASWARRACVCSWQRSASAVCLCCSRSRDQTVTGPTSARWTLPSGCGTKPELNPLAQVERAVAARVGLRRVEEPLVDAVECRARALVGTLDAERAHRQRLAHRLHAAVPL